MASRLYTTLAIAALAASGCGGSSGTTASTPAARVTPTAIASSPSGVAVPQTCGKPIRDLIVWSKTAGTEPIAQMLGDPSGTCGSTLDYLQRTSPTGPGDCTIAAWASDNPGYNTDAVSPKRPGKALLHVGGGC